MYLLLVSEDFVQDPPDEEEKSMKRKYCFTTYYYYYYCLGYYAYIYSLYNDTFIMHTRILNYHLIHYNISLRCSIFITNKTSSLNQNIEQNT